MKFLQETSPWNNHVSQRRLFGVRKNIESKRSIDDKKLIFLTESVKKYVKNR
mgnify:CR=1